MRFSDLVSAVKKGLKNMVSPEPEEAADEASAAPAAGAAANGSAVKALVMHADKCTACLQCEIACSEFHEGSFNPSQSRIKVFEIDHGRIAIPYTCTQCEEAWCLKACPTYAISQDMETGVKLVDESLCVGCKVCTMACPYGTINYRPDTGKVTKCDLCMGSPACVDACPTGAITYV